jgi:hypothetical protein
MGPLFLSWSCCSRGIPFSRESLRFRRKTGLDSPREVAAGAWCKHAVCTRIRNSTYCLSQPRSASFSIDTVLRIHTPYEIGRSRSLTSDGRSWNCGTCGTSSPLLKH